MTMILEAGQACHLANNCPYNEPFGRCHGALTSRQNEFSCDYVVNGQLILDAGSRNPLDQTGKMKVIME